jgi:hypothetical protein
MYQLYNENQEALKLVCTSFRYAAVALLVYLILKWSMTQYIWRVKTRLPERYLTLCKVLTRGKMNTCLIEFEDGYPVTTSRNDLMKYVTLHNRLAKWRSKAENQGTDQHL